MTGETEPILETVPSSLEDINQAIKDLEQGIARDRTALNQAVTGAAEKLVHFLLVAANQGQPAAQFSLGRLYERGIGVPKNEEHAAVLYLCAAEQGYFPAQFRLGLMYEQGRGVTKDEAAATRFFSLAARQDDAWTHLYFDALCYDGLPVAVDEAETERLLRSVADHGTPWTQTVLGKMHYAGKHVPKSETEAARFFRLAADQGDPTAQTFLGKMLEAGEGMPQDEAAAFRFYRLAADQGFAQAQCSLARMYLDGSGITKNKAEAAHLFRLAADQGLAQAQCSLALMLAEGSGVPKDQTEAARLARLAADQGDADGQFTLGIMYLTGRGVLKNEAEGARLLHLAADQGHDSSQHALGKLYRSGIGVPKNEAEGLRYFTLAAGQGDEDARRALANARAPIIAKGPFLCRELIYGDQDGQQRILLTVELGRPSDPSKSYWPKKRRYPTPVTDQDGLPMLCWREPDSSPITVANAGVNHAPRACFIWCPHTPDHEPLFVSVSMDSRLLPTPLRKWTLAAATGLLSLAAGVMSFAVYGLAGRNVLPFWTNSPSLFDPPAVALLTAAGLGLLWLFFHQPLRSFLIWHPWLYAKIFRGSRITFRVHTAPWKTLAGFEIKLDPAKDPPPAASGDRRRIRASFGTAARETDILDGTWHESDAREMLRLLLVTFHERRAKYLVQINEQNLMRGALAENGRPLSDNCAS